MPNIIDAVLEQVEQCETVLASIRRSLSGSAAPAPVPVRTRAAATRSTVGATATSSKTKTAGKTDNGKAAMSLSDRVLSLAQLGHTKAEILTMCKRTGAYPNHIGIAITRHVKAGRIVEGADGKYHAVPDYGADREAAAA